MNYFIKLNILFFLIFSLNTRYKANSQGVISVISFADYQYESGNVLSALREYQRAMFFEKSENQGYLLSQTANCYYSLENYEMAMTYYDYAFNIYVDDSMKNDCLFQKASCLIMIKNFNLALVELYSFDEIPSKYYLNKKHFYEGLCYFGLDRFEDSFRSFTNCIYDEPTKKEKLEELLKDKKRLMQPNPKTAFFMSLLVPGMGQIYSGDLKNGINSFLLCGGLLAIGYNISLKYNYLDAILGILPWYQRYYQGGFRNAEKIAEKKRSANRNKFFQEILKIIADQDVSF